ncbi:peroxiredoxin-like family protein [Chamaesiphon polymorphus]|uniref:thioredoxin-dependent peroxiredoxin n=1 Tax=Chamaesiphon polymorphus CCALA 037 TaxID=2107692 RepID=A0A2T1GKR8_9CYAN|nr:peroxiredoxin-like family protein [Chamaesiphon polymorphus]PSB58441.1 alkyl hydroperoxide reductase [Chamaesiphon polymorphus CCALA 037]
MTIQIERTTSPKLIMGHPAPSLELKTLDGNVWNLAKQPTDKYTAIVFYRGLHCPFCQEYIAAVDKQLAEFNRIGVNVIAISGDTLERAQQFKAVSKIENLALGYGLTQDDMHKWGLYISKGHFESEPAIFSEPATFIIKPDGRLYYANVGTHPFARPDLSILLRGLDYIVHHDYPFRGTEW